MNTPWSKSEVVLLKLIYSITSPSELILLFPKRSYAAIKAKAITYGLKRENDRKTYSDKPIGFERIRSYGYTEVKVEHPNIFKAKQRLIWEENFGTIPTGHNVQFKDGNNTNFDPFNLYTTTRNDQMRNENSLMVRYPIEIQNLIHTKCSLTKQIQKITKNKTI